MLEYFALSYMWGEKYAGEIHPAVPILVDGELSRIGKNLATALHRLRSKNADVYIWADAICINQSDDVENDSQIKQMRDIYANAAETKVWLGEGDACDKIMQAIHDIGNLMVETGTFDAWKTMLRARRRSETTEYQAWQDKVNALMAQIMETREANSFSFLEFRHFMDLPYWSRVWILQEVDVS
jgi:hypothetical protein